MLDPNLTVVERAVKQANIISEWEGKNLYDAINDELEAHGIHVPGQESQGDNQDQVAVMGGTTTPPDHAE